MTDEYSFIPLIIFIACMALFLALIFFARSKFQKKFNNLAPLKPQIDEFLQQVFKENSSLYTAVYSSTAFRNCSANKELAKSLVLKIIFRILGYRVHPTQDSDIRYDYIFIFGNNKMFLVPIYLDSNTRQLTFNTDKMFKLDESNIANIKYRKNGDGAEIKMLDNRYILLSIPKIFFKNNNQSTELQAFINFMTTHTSKINNLASIRA